MRKLSGVLVAALFFGLVVWFVTRPKPVVPAVAPVAVESLPPVAETPLDTVAPTNETRAPSDTLAREMAAPSSRASATNAAPSAGDLAEIRGRFLLPGGAAAGGVGLQLRGFPGDQERLLKFGAPPDWKDIEGASGDDGRFVLRFEPPRAFQFFLESSFANFCQESWRWGEIEPGKVIDVGNVPLVRGGSIRGRILDSKGRSLTKGWTVHAEAGSLDWDGGKDQTRVVARPDEVSGQFLLTGLPPGRVALSANSRIANWIQGPRVEVKAGEETAADINYDGPDLESRISLTVFTRPFYAFEFGEFEFVLQGGAKGEIQAKKQPGSSQMFVFEDLAPGSYRIELRDPRFRPWSVDGIEPGTSRDVKLKGNAALLVAVVDDATGEPVRRYSLDIRYERTNSSPSSFRIQEEKGDPPADGLFDGIVPAPATAIVRVAGYSSCEVPMLDLSPNERRVVSARLMRASKLSGRVVSGPDRVPIDRAKVEILPARPANEFGGFASEDLSPNAKSTETDAMGRFALEGLSLGAFTLRASLNRLCRVEQSLTISPGQPHDEIELVLPARAWLAGKILAPQGATLAGSRLLAAPPPKTPQEEWMARAAFFEKDDVTSAIESDGSFRLGPIPAGDCVVTLLLPDVKIPSGMGGWSGQPGGTIELGRVELAPNVETRRDFELGDRCPGTFAIQATVDGLPAANWAVFVKNDERGQMASYVALDGSGKGRSEALLPGSYGFLLRLADGGNSFPVPVTSTLGPNQTVNVVLALQLFEGTFVVLDDENGGPLAEQDVMLVPDEPDIRTVHSVRTDAQGRASIKLPAGRYRMSLGFPAFGASGANAPTIDWPTSGASPPEVRLKRPKRG